MRTLRVLELRSVAVAKTVAWRSRERGWDTCNGSGCGTRDNGRKYPVDRVSGRVSDGGGTPWWALLESVLIHCEAQVYALGDANPEVVRVIERGRVSVHGA